MKRLFPAWALVWILTALMITSIPYILGILVTPAEMTFSGNLLDSADIFSYYANMQLGKSGYWLYQLPYSAQPNHPVLLFSLYIALGHLARLVNLSIPLVFHIARIILAAVFALVSYRFLSRFLQSESERKLAFGLLLFTSGLGWLAVRFFENNTSGSLTPDIWIFEASGFGSMVGFPHFLLNATLMMVLLQSCQSMLDNRKYSSFLMGVFSGLGIALIHPQQLVVVGAVSGLTVVIHFWKDQRNLWKNVFFLFLMFLPAVVLSAVLSLQSLTDPYLSSWLSQGNTYSPSFWSLFILYGPTLIFAIFGFLRFVASPQLEITQAAIWFIIVPFFLYLPVNVQRRFIEGWFIPVAIFAAIGWFQVISPWLRRRIRPMAVRLVLAFMILLVALTPAVQLAGMIANAYFVSPYDFAHLSADEVGAIQYLRANANCEDVILSSYKVGNLLPAYVCIKSFVGHWSLTPFFHERLADVDEFFNPDTPAHQRAALIDEFNIRYVYFEEYEANRSIDFLEQAEYLKLVYQNSTISIYETQP